MQVIDKLISGQSAPIKELKNLISIVAPSASSVLIQGETGTGKDVVANAIHAASQRNGRLVSVNCAAIPAELGYGAKGAGGIIPPDATQYFTMKLLSIAP